LEARVVLTDYVYVDDKRLNRHFEQISSPVKYETVPIWSGEISLTGPKAGGSQARFPREKTQHEKISQLTEHLEKEHLVEAGRLRDDSYTEFRREKCWARRVLLHPDNVSVPLPYPLYFWISLKNDSLELGEQRMGDYSEGGQVVSRPVQSAGNLVLLEDFKPDDFPNHSRWSDAGTLYNALLSTMGDDLQESEAGGTFWEQPWREEAWQSLVHHDPYLRLRQLGAEVGQRRVIRTLYRLRVVFNEFDEPQAPESHETPPPISAVGYPIFIEALLNP
jgi:hypothetical protein